MVRRFLAFPTRALTGQQMISSGGYGSSRDLSRFRSAGRSPSHTGHILVSGPLASGCGVPRTARSRGRDDVKLRNPLARPAREDSAKFTGLTDKTRIKKVFDGR